MASIGAASGGNAATAILTDATPYSSGSGIRTAAFRIANDGYVYHGDNGTYTQQYAWKQSGAVADFDVYASVVYGSPSGTTGTWVNLATTRDWEVTDVAQDGSDETAELTIQIRNASTLAVLTTATITLAAARLL